MRLKFEAHTISEDCVIALVKGLAGIGCDSGKHLEVKRELEKFGFKCEILTTNKK